MWYLWDNCIIYIYTPVVMRCETTPYMDGLWHVPDYHIIWIDIGHVYVCIYIYIIVIRNIIDTSRISVCIYIYYWVIGQDPRSLVNIETAGKWMDIHLTIWLVVLTILKNISQWEGLSHIWWKNKKCSKPPTSYGSHRFWSIPIQCHPGAQVVFALHDVIHHSGPRDRRGRSRFF